MSESIDGKPRVAVLVPCYNEAATVAAVVEDFRAALPGACIRVFDNDSSDDTADRARAAGARVDRVAGRGKGRVVRRMFADVEADCYLLVDGDSTYDAATAPGLVSAVLADGADMAVACRVADSEGAYRAGHAWGNRLLTGFVNRLFGQAFTDMLSGYRAFSRRFVKSFPASSRGFEIETELSVHALALDMPVVELPSPYRERPQGSRSKLNTFADGLRILMTIARLFVTGRPLWFYGAAAVVLALVSLALGVPVVIEWLETGLVPRFPTAILASGLMVLAALSLFAGLLLESVARGRREARLLAYLAYPRAGPR